MPQTEVANKHHHIPKFYLKRWTCADRRLIEFRKHYGGVVKARACFTSATGYSTPGYALQGVPAEMASALEERFFKPVDTRASEVLNKIERGDNRFTDEERVAWAQFLISLVHRHPERIKQLRAMFEAITLQVSRAEQREWRRRRLRGDHDRLVDEMRADWEKNADQWQRRVLGLMKDSISSNLTGTHIVNMHWAVLTMPPNVPALLTSDMPVHWFAPLTDERCHILLPIGPKRLFYAVNTPEAGFLIRAQPPGKLLAFVNERSTRRAFDCVYGMTASALPYVERFMGVDSTPDQSDQAYTVPTPEKLREMRRRFKPK